ncbi:DUF1737 domain-containing protein [Muricauda sp. JGD-17]|uniref:DUF1737 domain-containing protein n=1 Tax=Flagellimonas ochracea TaxID=2696472 RepID=A0A964WYS2_9FLAO|nr:DUF1737 domain-containing protein [Allomuricauda ochracea]NAY93505.1 DUF1737 domain-containing protein [Allomuricauda ochracea]
MEYNVAVSNNRDRLVEMVNTKIGEGWAPKGGISMIEEEDGSKAYAQAMIRRT